MWPTPEVTDEPETTPTPTKNQGYLSPATITEWTDFELETIRSIANDKIFDTVKRVDSLQLGLVFIQDTDTDIEAEDDVRLLIDTSIKGIIGAALQAVSGKLPSCRWKSWVQVKKDKERDKEKKRKKDEEEKEKKKRRENSNKGTPGYDSPGSVGSRLSLNSPNEPIGYLKKKRGSDGKMKYKRLYPDSGARLHCDHGRNCPTRRTEILPKEYKQATHWRSREMLDKFVNKEDGSLKPGYTNDPIFWPVRQAYTYAVAFRCRYGCIMTTEEAFIFRVSPS